MATKPLIALPARADAADEQPLFRYWGKSKPDTTVKCMAVPRLSQDATTATIRMYGPIDPWGGFWGVSAKEVAEALDGLDDTVTELQLRINSPGGSCFEGLAILNLLRAHPARVTAVVDGLAASAASFIATGCDDVVMSPGTQLMIHDPWASAWGCNAAEMRKTASVLDKIADSMASLYAAAAGGTIADWRAVMIEETWYTAEEAVAAKLAARVAVVPDAGQATTAGTDPEPDTDPELDPSEDPEDRFDLSVFNYAGRSKAPMPLASTENPTKPPSASAVGSTETQEKETAVAFSDEQIQNMRTKLELQDTADEATIVANVSRVVDKLLELSSASTTDTPGAVPEGHVVIPKAKLDDLEAGARMATATAQKLLDAEVNEFLKANETKFLPANKASWADEYRRSPEETRKHFAQAPEIVPLTALGHEGDIERSAADEDYFTLFPDERPAEKAGA